MKTKANKTVRETAPAGFTVGSPGRLSRQAVHPAKIMVPVDFSDESQKAVRYAVALARHFGSTITLIHVVEPVMYPADSGYGMMAVEFLSKDTLRSVKARLAALGKKLAGGKLLERTVVLNGAPHFEITEAAKSLNIDLIVIGTHGYSGLNHALIGSTAEKVVRHAPCPVLVVRRREHEFVQ